MLTKEQIENIAMKYLLKNNYPIIIPGMVSMPEDESDEKYKKYMFEEKFAVVSFFSNFEYNHNDPNQELFPGSFIVYVNYITGDVYMPRHY